MSNDLDLRRMSIEYSLTKMVIEKELSESVKKGFFTNHFKEKPNEPKTNSTTIAR